MFMDNSFTRSGSWSAFFSLAAACAVGGCAATGGSAKAPGPGWTAAPEMQEKSAQREAIVEDCFEKWNSEGVYITYEEDRNRVYWYTCFPVDRENYEKVVEREIRNKIERCKEDPGRGECLGACVENPAHIWCDNCKASPHEYRCKQRRCLKTPDLPGCEDVTMPDPDVTTPESEGNCITIYSG